MTSLSVAVSPDNTLSLADIAVRLDPFFHLLSPIILHRMNIIGNEIEIRVIDEKHLGDQENGRMSTKTSFSYSSRPGWSDLASKLRQIGPK